MRRFVGVLAAVMIALLLTGCGQKAGNAEGDTDRPEPTVTASDPAANAARSDRAEETEEAQEANEVFLLTEASGTGSIQQRDSYDDKALRWGLPASSVFDAIGWYGTQGQGKCTYDVHGNLLTKIWKGEMQAAVGTFSQTTEYTYDSENRRLSAKECVEGGQNYNYESEALWTYDPHGSILTYEETFLNHDNDARLRSMVEYSYEYDENGSVLRRIMKRDRSDGQNFVQTTSYTITYYDNGRTKTRTERTTVQRDGNTTEEIRSYSYNEEGRLLKMSTESADSYSETVIEYSESGKELRRTITSRASYPQGDIVQEYVSEYDANDRRIAYYEVGGSRAERFEYDENGGMTKHIYLVRNVIQKTETFSYHPNGRIKEETQIIDNAEDAYKNSVRTRCYDEYGNLTRYTADGSDWHYELAFTYEQMK